MKKQSKINKKELLSEAIENIHRDRSQAQLLLTKLIEYMFKNEDRQKEVSFAAAKYLETLQRSNEQLVKIIQITRKRDDMESLSEQDREELFDMLNDNQNKEEE